MNIQHMKYAVAIADAGSINKASEDLLIAQPNLSRSVKELEADLGIRIFERSSRGMTLTPDGVQFISHAKTILQEISDLENQYVKQQIHQKTFALSGPRSSYISEAFSRFSTQVDGAAFELNFCEEHSSETLQHVCSENFDLGIIRYEEYYDQYFKELFEEKDLACELIAEFRNDILVNAKSPLAHLKEVTIQDLLPFVEIIHHASNDSINLNIPKTAAPVNLPCSKTVFLSDRASCLDLLRINPNAFCWSIPQDEHIEETLGLKTVPFAGLAPSYRDVLIHRKKHKLTPLDKIFITELIEAKRRYFRHN